MQRQCVRVRLRLDGGRVAAASAAKALAGPHQNRLHHAPIKRNSRTIRKRDEERRRIKKVWITWKDKNRNK